MYKVLHDESDQHSVKVNGKCMSLFQREYITEVLSLRWRTILEAHAY